MPSNPIPESMRISHTPLPWIIKKAGNVTEIWSDRGLVAELSLYPRGSQQADADAEFIVLACAEFSALREKAEAFDWLRHHSHITLRIDDPSVRYGVREEQYYPSQDLLDAVKSARAKGDKRA